MNMIYTQMIKHIFSQAETTAAFAVSEKQSGSCFFSEGLGRWIKLSSQYSLFSYPLACCIWNESNIAPQ